MHSKDLMPLDGQLCFSIYGATIAINRAYKPLLDELGITYPQYLVIAVLTERDGQTIGEIFFRGNVVMTRELCLQLAELGYHVGDCSTMPSCSSPGKLRPEKNTCASSGSSASGACSGRPPASQASRARAASAAPPSRWGQGAGGARGRGGGG